LHSITQKIMRQRNIICKRRIHNPGGNHV